VFRRFSAASILEIRKAQSDTRVCNVDAERYGSGYRKESIANPNSIPAANNLM
jgi:hypothetical protein